MKHFLGFTVICCLCILSCAKNERENEPWVLPVVDDVCTRMESDALKDYCLRHFDTDHDGTLSMQEAAKVSVINLYRVNIYGFNNGLSSVNPIKGIEYFVNLTCLYCYRMGLYHNRNLKKRIDKSSFI